jgi:hypothetical protein
MYGPILFIFNAVVGMAQARSIGWHGQEEEGSKLVAIFLHPIQCLRPATMPLLAFNQPFPSKLLKLEQRPIIPFHALNYIILDL